MTVKVDVELRDGAVCVMAKRAFNIFLSLDRQGICEAFYADHVYQ